MNLQSDDFDLFGLSRSFAQDRAAVDAAWKALQRQAHPDKFAAHPGGERLATRVAQELTVAYEGLLEHLGEN